MTFFGDINLKFPLLVTLIIMSSLNFSLSRVEHVKSSKTSGPVTYLEALAIATARAAAASSAFLALRSVASCCSITLLLFRSS